MVRTLPQGCRAILDSSRWDIQPIFPYLGEVGNVPKNDIFRTFNMGIGFTLVVRPDVADDVLARVQASGETAWIIGEIVDGERAVIVE
ncbi:MAG TPA: AIR synthase-related protein, partial [Armatimonadota bacterium]|nr:AIR synthase-related protein [Armatimonadota bacterium]